MPQEEPSWEQGKAPFRIDKENEQLQHTKATRAGKKERAKIQ